MIINQLRTALRTLLRDRVYTLLNMLGLTLGSAACLFLLLSIENDLGFDRHFENGDRIYRITTERNLPASSVFSAASPRSLGPFLESSFGFGSAQTRLSAERASQVSIRAEDRVFVEENFRFSDPTFFDVFKSEFLSGEAQSALESPFSVVLTRSLAEQLFPGRSPLGESVSVRLVGDGDWFDYTVTGVIVDYPEKTHFRINALATYEGHPLVGSPDEQDNWLGLDLYTYLKLNPSERAADIERDLNRGLQSLILERLTQAFDIQPSDGAAAGFGLIFLLQPISSIHLHSNLQGELHTNQDVRQVLMMATLAVFILLLACVNFINLSTARSLQRMKLVGVRQALGASRSSLVRGFLSESFIVSVVSVVAGILILLVARDPIGRLIDIYVSVPFWNAGFWVAVGALIVATTLAAGMYPAFVLSRPNPVQNLLSRQKSGSAFFRSSLVVFQFAISALLIVGSLTVHRQLDYMQNKELGYAPSGVMVLEGTESLRQRRSPLVDRMLALSGVDAIGSGQAVPGEPTPTAFVRPIAAGSDDSFEVSWLTVTEGYIESLGISVLEGRSFEAGNPLDSVSVILNQEAVRTLGLRQPIGSQIEADNREFTVVGVVADYHFKPLHVRIEPLLLFGPDPFSQNRSVQTTIVRYSGGSESELQVAVENVWTSVAPDLPLRSYFLRHKIGAMYPSTARMNGLGLVSGLFALMIATLGLTGLATATVSQRQREIGVRKVLGASAKEIVHLLAKDLTRPVALSLTLSLPLGWVFSNSWLEAFAYSVPRSASVLVITAVVCFAVALVTVTVQGIRAARWEPTRHLNSE